MCLNQDEDTLKKTPLVKSAYQNIFSFSTKTYDLGAQKNPLTLKCFAYLNLCDFRMVAIRNYSTAKVQCHQ